MRASLQLRSARLRVADLGRAQDFYAGVLGLVPGSAHGHTLAMHAPGAATPLLTLIETPGAQPKPPGVPGLFHIALLVPDRPSLARILRRLAKFRAPLALSDHGVSEAIYLADPDGNGLEIYGDRQPDAWRDAAGKLVIFTRRLTPSDLLAAAPDQHSAGLPAGTVLGHVHLRTHSLEAAGAFYTGQLGLAVTTREYPGALFLSADGYHHHIAVNTWGPRTTETGTFAGLESIDIALRDLKEPRRLIDPDGVGLNLMPLNDGP